ncbi:MAG: hypothetical protein J5787_06070 [Alphaproteobacteria bacterium]|nr:hypothetical protein [Alphaproteobacteria bacterium]MBO4643712.1 hypothetical protein [Alphaproteobacteria bacterium]
MKKILFSLIFLILAAVLSSCVHNEAMYRSDTDGANGASPSFAQFNDIPIPEKATMDLKSSLLLGGESAWIGRLVFSAPYTLNSMFDFYMSEMPKFGWKEVTVVRSKVSVLSFTNAERVATVQLEADMVNGTIVSFTVSPKSKGTKQTVK